MAFKDPDVVLTLDPAATSVLEGQLLDQSGNPLYHIETADAHTKLTPAHSYQRSNQRRNAAMSPMSIRWPQRYSMLTTNGDTKVSAPDAMVTVNGETMGAKRLLRCRKLVTLVTLYRCFLYTNACHSDGKSYKFRIDGYKSTFRWKRKGRQYSVSRYLGGTSPFSPEYQLFVSGYRSAIATLSCDYLTATFRLEIYGTSIPSYHGQDRPGFVSSILLDYIVLTALILVTPPLEWRRVCGTTATRTTAQSFNSESMEEPTAFVYSDTRQRHPINLFDTSCTPLMQEISGRTFAHPSSTAYASTDMGSMELLRYPSRTATSSSRTLVQSLARTVLASISSDDSSSFFATEDASSYYGHSILSQSAPPPYEPARSIRVR